MADPSIGKAALQITVDKAQTASAVESAVNPAMLGAAKNAAQLLAGVFASKELANAAKVGFAEITESQRVAAQSSVLLRRETNLTAADINSLGQSMLDLAGFDDEAARSAANVLLRFGAIHDAQTLKRVEGDAADLAVSLGEDLPSAAQTLGQALANPEKASRLLRSSIGALSTAQLDTIKQFQAMGDTAGAQGVILKALEDRIGGAAAEYGDTLPAALHRAGEDIKNAKASIVEGLAPALDLGANLAADFARGVEELPGPLRAVAGLAVGAGVGIAGIAQPIAGIIGSVNQLRAARLLSAAAADVEATAEVGDASAKTASAAATDAQLVAAESLFAADQTRIAQVAGLTGTEVELTAATEARAAATSALALAEGEAALAASGLAAADAGVAVAGTAATTASSGVLASIAGIGATVAGVAGPLALLVGTVTTLKVVYDNFVHGVGFGGNEAAANVTKLASGLRSVADVGFKRALSDDIGALTEGDHALGSFGEAATKLFEETLRTAPQDAARMLNSLRDLQTEGQLTGVDLDHLASEIDGTKQSSTEAAQRTTEFSGAVSGLNTTASNTAGLDAQRAAVDKLNGELETAKSSVLAASTALAPADIRAKRGAIGEDEAKLRLADANTALSAARQTGDKAAVAKATRDVTKAQLDLESSSLDLAQARVDLIVQQKEAIGGQVTEREKLGLLDQQLGVVNSTIGGPVHAILAGYKTDLDAAAASIDKLTQAQITNAASKLKIPDAANPFAPGSTLAGLLGIPGASLSGEQPTPPPAIKKIKKFAAGGFVDEPFGAPVPAIVHGGEFVLSHDMLANLAHDGGSSHPRNTGPTTHIETVNLIGDHGRTPIAKLSAEMAVGAALVPG